MVITAKELGSTAGTRGRCHNTQWRGEQLWQLALTVAVRAVLGQGLVTRRNPEVVEEHERSADRRLGRRSQEALRSPRAHSRAG